MDAKKCDRCGSFYPNCMNALKIFMEVQHVTPYIAKEGCCDAD